MTNEHLSNETISFTMNLGHLGEVQARCMFQPKTNRITHFKVYQQRTRAEYLQGLENGICLPVFRDVTDWLCETLTNQAMSQAKEEINQHGSRYVPTSWS